MRTSSLRLALIAVVGLFAIPLSAQAGPTTCPANAICIDESVEGALFPSVIFNGTPLGTGGVVNTSVPEQWSFQFFMPFPSGNNVEVSSGGSLGLLEPGSQAPSDALTNFSVSIDNNTHHLNMSFDLFSDNDLGQIGASGPFDNTLVEDGTFQQVPGAFFVTDRQNPTTSTFNVFFRSDIEVPEPASLALLGTALVGLV